MLKNILKSTYEKKSKAENQMRQDGFILDKDLSNISDRVYYNKDSNKVLMTYRGTHNLIKDIPSDLGILFGTIHKTKRFKDNKKNYEKVKEKYSDAERVLVGHSLGGSLASSLGTPDDKVYTFNKGVGITHKKTGANETSYRHNSDVISLMSATDKNQKSFGSYLVNPLTSHSTDQLNENIFI